MIEVTERVIYGDAWERSGLNKRDRSLIVIGKRQLRFGIRQFRRSICHRAGRRSLRKLW